MTHFNYLGGLRREIHHIKLMKDGTESYEPAMVILCHERKGFSFIITLDAMWKYIEPSDNLEPGTIAVDAEDFDRIVERANFRMRLAVGRVQQLQALEDMKCIEKGAALARDMGLLRCTSYNLAKCLQHFGITICRPSAAQLLLWIQDGLDDLRSFPEHPNDETHGVMGEVTLWEGGRRVGTKEITVEDKDVYIHPGSEAKN
jgi:hypothetical protein